jgi:phage tail-like protein
MRATVPGLETPRPLGPALPAVYQEDALLQRFLTAFDEVLAPVFCTLDNLPAYFDPRLTPPDFLAWLAGWLGLTIDDNWPIERRRTLASEAAGLYRWRGTVKGLATEVALHTGGDAEVNESGGIVWSARPGGPIPGTREAHVRVLLRVADRAAVNLERLETMIAGAIPADATYEVVVLGAGDVDPATVVPLPAPAPPPVTAAEPEAAGPDAEGSATPAEAGPDSEAAGVGSPDATPAAAAAPSDPAADDPPPEQPS